MFTKRIIASAIGVLLIFSIALCSLSGCKAPNEDEESNNSFEDKGLEVGFLTYLEPNTHVPASPAWSVAFRSDVSVFPIDDVTLEAYFGISFGESAEDDLEVGRAVWGPIDIFFRNESKTNSILMKRTEENLTSEKYRVKTVYYSETRMYVNYYNHHESFTIPKELFEKDTGYVMFICGGEVLNDPYHGYTEIMWCRFFYKKLDNNRVELSFIKDKFYL